MAVTETGGERTAAIVKVGAFKKKRISIVHSQATRISAVLCSTVWKDQ